MPTMSTPATDIEILMQTLYENEVSGVVAYFSGSSDSGQIDRFVGYDIDEEQITEKELASIIIQDYTPNEEDNYGDWFDGRWQRRNFKINPLKLTELVENVAYRELENRHGGWEIDAGSSGEIAITVPKTSDGKLDKSECDNKSISVDIEYGYDEDEEYED